MNTTQEITNEGLVLLLVDTLVVLAKQNQPQQFKILLASVLGVVMGNMTDRYWEDFEKILPCEYPNCMCHLDVISKFTQLCKLMREDYKKQESDVMVLSI